jgi:hypothetical protein
VFDGKDKTYKDADYCSIKQKTLERNQLPQPQDCLLKHLANAEGLEGEAERLGDARLAEARLGLADTFLTDSFLAKGDR